jgi:uncharacterized protein
MRFLITGATGFVGRHLWGALRDAGHEATVFARDAKSARKILSGTRVIEWNGTIGLPPEEAFEGVDVIVNLIGETIARRWNRERKRRVRDSRVLPTRSLRERMEQLQVRPRALISMAATGIYGDRGEEVLTEASRPGTGFLAKVAQEWESAAFDAEALGLRVAVLRSGIVLGRDGGMLPKTLLPFRLGLGGRLGSGRQYVPWIHLADLIGLFLHVATNDSVRGPINAVAPEPVSNGELTRAIGQALGRPAALAIPGFALKWVLGEMGQELLLSSQRVSPVRALEIGYEFKFPLLAPALADLLPSRGAIAPRPRSEASTPPAAP